VTALRFDDIDGINASAGGDYGDWGPEIEVTQDKINQFAELTGDHQWIHVDIERANAGPFGGPIAHGFLTLSLLPALTAGNTLALDGVLNAVGSKVHARSKLVSAEAKGSGTLIKSEIAVHVVGAEKPSLVYQMLVLYMG